MSLVRRLNRKAIALATVWSGILTTHFVSAATPELLEIDTSGSDSYAVLAYSGQSEPVRKRITIGPNIVGANVRRPVRVQQLCDRLDQRTHTHTFPGSAYPIVTLSVRGETDEEPLPPLVNWNVLAQVQSVWQDPLGQWFLRSVLDGTRRDGVVEIHPPFTPQVLLPVPIPYAMPTPPQLLNKSQYNYIWNGFELRRIDATTQTIHSVTQAVYRDCAVLDHVGREVVFVQPFQVDGYPLTNGQVGGDDIANGALYQFDSNLLVTDKSYVYFENGKFYHLKVTKEILKRNLGRGEYKVGFLVFSRAEHERLDAIPEAYHIVDTTTPLHNQFQNGVYEIQSVKRKKHVRPRDEELDEETWKHLESGTSVTVRIPKNIMSIPGLIRQVYTQDAFRREGLDIEQRVTLGTQRISDHYDIPTHQNLPTVILIGPAGSGKTTLTHLLMGKSLREFETAEGVKVIPRPGDELSGVQLSNSGIFRSTDLPNFFFNDSDALTVSDFPGFGDPRGIEYDIANGRILHSFLRVAGQNLTKIALVITGEKLKKDGGDRRVSFFNLLNRLGELAPEGSIETLTSSLFFIINKTSLRMKVGDLLREILSDERENLNSNALKLLWFIIENFNERVINILDAEHSEWTNIEEPAKTTLSTKLVRSQTGFRGTPNIRQRFMADASAVRAYAADEANRLNNRAITYLETEGVRQITHKMRADIAAHPGDLASLRTAIAQRLADLRALRQAGTAYTKFVSDFKALVGSPVAIPELEFAPEMATLQQMDKDIDFKLSDWKQALEDAEKALEELSKPAVGVYDAATNVLTINSILVSVADIQIQLTAHATDDIKRIDVFAANAVFVDGDFKCDKGISLKIVAPKLVVRDTGSATVKREINLSGAHGKARTESLNAGDHGHAGHPGVNAGHFWGYLGEIIGKKHLKIVSNGGNGGDGQAGATGVSKAGQAGADNSNAAVGGQVGGRVTIYPRDMGHEFLGKMKHLCRTLRARNGQEIFEHETYLDYTSVTYDRTGGKGPDGGNGGNGGVAGLPGAKGDVVVVVNGYIDTTVQTEANAGNQGNAGNGGDGGSGGNGGTGNVTVEWTAIKAWDGEYRGERQVNYLDVPNYTADVRNSPGAAGSVGSKGTAGVNGTAASPTTIPAMDSSLTTYEQVYFARARDPKSSVWTLEFPGIFSFRTDL
jgi:hypothetical protein